MTVIDLFNEITQIFIDTDNELKKFNADYINSLIRNDAENKLVELNQFLSSKLHDAKINMAAFDLGLKTKKFIFTDVNDESKATIMTVKQILENGHIKNLGKITEIENPSHQVKEFFKNAEEHELLLNNFSRICDNLLSYPNSI